ncbi:MAG: acyl-CoA thioesterase, partial [Novosphingobium sp.]
MSNRFTLTFTAEPQHIDELGHVNNAVWVDWIQQIATAHWSSVAAPGMMATQFWSLTATQIDGPASVGEGLCATQH